MSIATRIESINNNIENAYNQLETLGVKMTGVSKNLSNLSPQINSLYKDLIKVNNKDTSVELDTVKAGKMEMTLCGNTIQNGVPTPSAPIPINNVNGENVITIIGKNLFNSNQLLNASGWTVDNNGYYTGSAQNLKAIFGPDTPGFTLDKPIITGKYTITLTTYSDVSNGNPKIYILYTDGTTTESTEMNYLTHTQLTLTTTTNKTISKICFTCNNNATNIYFKNIQIEKSSVATFYEPNKTISYPITLNIQNLLPINQIETQDIGGLTITNLGNKTLQINGTSNSNIKLDIPFTMTLLKDVEYAWTNLNPIDISSNITISLRDINNDSITYMPFNSKEKIYKTNTNQEVKKIRIFIDPGENFNNYIFNISFSQGTSIDLNKINNTEDIIIKNHGKNLCKLTQPGLIVGSNGSISSSQYSKTIIDTRNINTLAISGDFSILGDKVLRIGGCDTYPVLNGTGVRLPNLNSNKVVDVTDYNYIILTWVLSGAWSEGRDAMIESSFMVTASSTIQKYEPYGNNEWYKYSKINTITLDGSEDGWSKYEYSFINSTFFVGKPESLCSHFENVGTNWSSGDETYRGKYSTTNADNAFKCMPSTDMTLEEFKEWLSINPVTLCYESNVWKAIKIENLTLQNQLNILENAQSSNGKVYILQTNNDLPFIIDASALKNS